MLEQYLDAWTMAADVGRDKKGPLFRSMHKGDKVAGNAMTRFDVFQMIKRRAEEAGLPYSSCCQTYRAATGITTYLGNGGTLGHAQNLANHESPRTTKLYDRGRESCRSTKWKGSNSIITLPRLLMAALLSRRYHS